MDSYSHLHLLTAEWLPIKWYFCFLRAPKSGDATLFSKEYTEFALTLKKASFKNPYAHKHFSK
jgi:hypothetical protein